MKVNVLLILSLTAILESCTNSTSDKIRDFIPGTYARQIHDEFTNGGDTLVISEQDLSGGVYFIENRKGYQQHLDGKVFPPERKMRKWTGVYDPKTHQLMIQNTEDIITFLPEKDNLLLGRTEYDKVKDK